MIFIALVLVILGGLEVHYEPRLETTRTKDVLLWYNKPNGREYIRLFRL